MKSKEEIEVKTDCFAYKNTELGEECDSLTKLYCSFEKCRFYKQKKCKKGE